MVLQSGAPIRRMNSAFASARFSSGSIRSAACNAPHKPPGARPPPQFFNSSRSSSWPHPAATDWAQLCVLGTRAKISSAMDIVTVSLFHVPILPGEGGDIMKGKTVLPSTGIGFRAARPFRQARSGYSDSELPVRKHPLSDCRSRSRESDCRYDRREQNRFHRSSSS